jgi:hypothetical protein
VTVFYLAGRYSRREELCRYRADLIMSGHAVTARWLDGSHQLDNVGTPIGDRGEALVEAFSPEAQALAAKFAFDDYDDVMAAEELIAFTETPGGGNGRNRGGRHVELGIALARQIPITIVGPRENVFCWLPFVAHYDVWADLLPYLGLRARSR